MYRRDEYSKVQSCIFLMLCFFLIAPFTALAQQEGSATATLSGTVKTSTGDALSTPTLLLNGKKLALNPTSGRFSTAMPIGEEYTLTIDDPEWFFTNPESKGTVYGDIELNFVGFSK